jgi:hypothetical protein
MGILEGVRGDSRLGFGYGRLQRKGTEAQSVWAASLWDGNASGDRTIRSTHLDWK